MYDTTIPPTTYNAPVKSSSSLRAVRVEAGAGATRSSGGSVRGILPQVRGIKEHPRVESEVGGGREVTKIRNTNVLGVWVYVCVCG